MKKLALCLSLIVLSFTAVYSQPRLNEKPEKPARRPETSTLSSFAAQYEGGMFGFSEKEKGILMFDEENERLVFTDKNKKERFSVPYKSINVIYPQPKRVQSTGGKVMERIPIPGAAIAGIFMREKLRYMILNFDDPDIEAKGSMNFKFDNKDLLAAAILAIGEKAKLKQRGDAFYR